MGHQDVLPGAIKKSECQQEPRRKMAGKRGLCPRCFRKMRIDSSVDLICDSPVVSLAFSEVNELLHQSTSFGFLSESMDSVLIFGLVQARTHAHLTLDTFAEGGRKLGA